MSNWDVVSEIRRSCSVTRAFDGAGLLCSGPRVYGPRSGGGRRRRVTGFSSASSRRFRALLVSLEGPPGYAPWSYTLTLRDTRSPSWWRSRVNAFSQRLRRYRVPGFWRVELQKRGTPHLHCVLYLPAGLPPARLRDAWLEVCGVSADPDHLAHAVDFRPIDSEGWFNYVAAHATKHKADQLGWQGRQWGVWVRSLLRARSSSMLVVSHPAHAYGMRLYSRWLRLRGRRFPVGTVNEFVRFVDAREIDTVFRCVLRGLVRERVGLCRDLASWFLLALLGFQPSQDCADALWRGLWRIHCLLWRCILEPGL